MSLIGCISFVNRYVFGPVLPVLLFSAGIYMIFKFRGFIFTHPVKILSVFFRRNSAPDSISPFKAVSLALAGTLGVGNIIGVSSAIAIGGPGAVFWMWISAIAAMFIKYAEIVLAMITRKSDGMHYHGGAMYYIKNKTAASVFAVILLLSSFPLGNFIQVKAASDACQYAFNISPVITGIVFSGFTLMVIAGGVRSISNLTVRLIPFLSAVFIVISLYIILCNIRDLPDIIRLIIRDAFGRDSVAGGTGGFLITTAMRCGVTRGILSNEAGCGTAPTAHAEANTDSPAEQGCWGIFEVFTDTIVLCSLTAFVILLSYEQLTEYAVNGMLYTFKAYEFFLGLPAVYIIGGSICLFAYATIICWAHYGLEGLYFLSPKTIYKKAYILIYGLAVFFGAVASFGFVWESADFAVGAMTILNTVFVIGSCDEAARITALYFRHYPKVRRVFPAYADIESH
ncbi:MAG: amino acid carrier protein [Eubacteriales bacterium]|nr:amino acid carrier protein [Eubacteriales bacterium]